jgi:hypothetical protein
MKVNDGHRGVVFVGRDSSGSYIELQTSAGGVMDQPRSVLLTPEGARRLAAAILFEAGRLDRTESEETPPAAIRRSA